MVEKLFESLGMAIGKEPRRGLVRRSVAGNQIGRNGPGRAAETKKRRFRRQFCAQPPDGLIDGFELRPEFCSRHGVNFVDIQRIELRPGSFFKANVATDGIGNDQNVGKEDCRIKAIPADRLQCHLNGIIRRIAEVEETSGLCARFPVLGKIATCLAHEPDRGR